MLKQLSVRTFKSLENVEIDLGLVNVFIGANGSGKSICLKPLEFSLPRRTVKLTIKLYLTEVCGLDFQHFTSPRFLPERGKRIPPHLFFGAAGRNRGMKSRYTTR